MKTDNTQLRMLSQEKTPSEVSSSKCKDRRNSLDSSQTEQKPKSVGDIDNLIASVSKIALTSDDNVKLASLSDDFEHGSSSATTSDEEEDEEDGDDDDDEEEDELSNIEPKAIETVTASYISSMKAILSSLDKSLQFASKEKSNAADKTVKKDTALPLPRFIITGGTESAPATKVENKDSKAPASPRRTDTPAEKRADDKETTAAAPPTRRLRSRTNPNAEEGHIVRSSKQALPRRRFVPNAVDTVPYQFNNVNDFPTLNTPDLTLDDLLKNAHGGYTKPQVNNMDFYGFPDLTSPTNMDLNGIGFGGNNAMFSDNQFSTASTPELVACGLDANLGVYSSPAAPLTPPSASFSMPHQLSSPYGTPQDMSYYTPDSMTYANGWSAPSSAVGSPPQQTFSPQQSMSHGLQHQSIIAMKQHILLPLAKDYTLMQFAPLIAAASHRLDEGRILCLRDLEKYLLFKSQEMGPSPQASLDFMERFFIRCQAAIPYVEAAGGELIRRGDTPYYDGYFMDVLAQYKGAAASQAPPQQPMIIMKRNSTDSIHQHKPSLSQQMRQGTTGNYKMSSGRVGKHNSVSHTSHASISAGMHEQILAAVMQQASQDVKLNLGLDDTYAVNQPMFPLSPESEDQGGNDNGSEEDDNTNAVGGIARKKRPSSQKPLGGHVCMHRDDDSGAICGKKYNRPCDLKKHGKTHSRPHKCSEPSCLYHDKGFPTEKERDRHETDRHSDAPVMFHCEFPPCPYKSKRESNCKQHMEKQHNYVYERSKHNPRNPNGNADVAKRASLSKASPVKDTTGGMNTMPVNAPGMPVFENGIHTPPNDLVSGFFPNNMPMMESEMPKLHNMYLTPSPENSQTFRSGSVSTVADGEAAFDNNNWGQYAPWPQQQMMPNNQAYSFGMASAE